MKYDNKSGIYYDGDCVNCGNMLPVGYENKYGLCPDCYKVKRKRKLKHYCFSCQSYVYGFVGNVTGYSDLVCDLCDTKLIDDVFGHKAHENEVEEYETQL